jgi:hypothetical protein
MSLLLGARGKAHVVVLTDGLSFLQTEEGNKVQQADLQKVFASQTKPYVLAHHGQNKIGAFGCETLLPDLIEDELDKVWSRGLNVAVAKAIESLDHAVSQHLKTVRVPTVFGLWLAGLWPCTEMPEIVELVWHRPGPRRVRVDTKTHGDMVWGGWGAKHVNELMKQPLDDRFNLEKVFDAPAEYAMEFLKRLYAAADKRQQAEGERQFGGQARMALITEHGVDLDKIELPLP